VKVIKLSYIYEVITNIVQQCESNRGQFQTNHHQTTEMVEKIDSLSLICPPAGGQNLFGWLICIRSKNIPPITHFQTNIC